MCYFLQRLNDRNRNKNLFEAYIIHSHFLLFPFSVSRCGITGLGCFYLAKVLCTVSQLFSKEFQKKTDWQAVELKALDISMNYLGDHGVKEISPGLKNPYSHLRTLE